MTTSIVTRLARSVADELTVLRDFVNLLQQEQQALSGGDTDRLTTMIPEKTRLAGRLAMLADQRNDLLTASALPTDRSGMELWLDQQTQIGETTPPPRTDWNNLLALAIEARALNETNGKLIATRLQHNQQTLNALLAAGNQASLYGPDGQTRTSGGGRLFGAA